MVLVFPHFCTGGPKQPSTTSSCTTQHNPSYMLSVFSTSCTSPLNWTLHTQRPSPQSLYPQSPHSASLPKHWTYQQLTIFSHTHNLTTHNINMPTHKQQQLSHVLHVTIRDNATPISANSVRNWRNPSKTRSQNTHLRQCDIPPATSHHTPPIITSSAPRA